MTGKSHTEVAGLMYHEVTDDPRTSGFQRPGALPYTFSPRVFKKHLDAIAQGELRPEIVTALDLERGRHLALTFDDGGASAMYVAEELARRGWLAPFLIITSRIGERTVLKASRSPPPPRGGPRGRHPSPPPPQFLPRSPRGRGAAEGGRPPRDSRGAARRAV